MNRSVFSLPQMAGETSVVDLQTVYRITDNLQIICEMSAECLLELICNLCRRSADKGGINNNQSIRHTAPIKRLLFLS